MKHYFAMRTQHGFALASVMIMMFILALVVAALLSNQALSVRETSDVLAAATRAQASHNIHRKCLQYARSQMTQDTLSRQGVLDLTQANNITFDGVTGSCVLEAVQTDTPSTWLPRLKISSKVDGRTEITEWGYIPCEIGGSTSNCFVANRQLMIKTLNTTDSQTLTPQFEIGATVQVGWRQE